MGSEGGDERGADVGLHGRDDLELTLDGSASGADEVGHGGGVSVRLDEDGNVLAGVRPGPVVDRAVDIVSGGHTSAAEGDHRDQGRR